MSARPPEGASAGVAISCALAAAVRELSLGPHVEHEEGTVAPTTKDELLNEAAREYKALHEALQGLNETQMTEVWLGTWSVRDIVAHIAGWHQEMSPALERLALSLIHISEPTRL